MTRTRTCEDMPVCLASAPRRNMLIGALVSGTIRLFRLADRDRSLRVPDAATRLSVS